MSFQGDSIFWVEVSKIVPNPFQPRREFDEAKLQELADSVRMYGILQPLTVTKKEIHRDDGAFYSEYELIAGERRLRAAKIANLSQVPVIIRSGEETEQEKLELAIIENLQREDLNAVDRAMAFKQLSDAFDLSHGQVAKKVGRSREYVSNTIRLLLLPEYMLESLKTADISEGHARSLLMLKDKPEEQDVVYREILLKKLSVREVERITRKIAADRVRKKDWGNTDPALIAIEQEFTDTLGTRVQISKTDYGGKLTIDYFSDEDLRNLLTLVRSQGGKVGQVATAAVDTEASGEAPVTQAAGAAVLAELAQATPLTDVPVAEVERDDRFGVEEVSPQEDPSAQPQPSSESSALAEVAADHSMDTTDTTGEPQPPRATPTMPESPSTESAPASDDQPVAPAEVAPVDHAMDTDTTGEPQPPRATPTMPESPSTESAPASVDRPVQEPSNTEQPPVEPAPRAEEPVDDDLYSIRNFSL